jgi:hypothetical protein
MSTPDHLNQIGKFISQKLTNPKLHNQKNKNGIPSANYSKHRPLKAPASKLYPKFGYSVLIKPQKHHDTIETGIDSSSKTLAKQTFTGDEVLNSNGRRKTT